MFRFALKNMAIKRLQIILIVEVQFKTALALAVYDFYAATQDFRQLFLAFCHIIHFQGHRLGLCGSFLGVGAQKLRLPHRKAQGSYLLGHLFLLLF